MVFNVSKHYDVVLIGKQGENLARTIQFDFSPWQADYGDGTVSILNKRNTDSSPYPVTLTTEGTIATWKPTSSDTQYAGAGFLEVVYTVNGIIAKSATFNTYTTPALGQSTTPPAPYQAWVDEVLEAKDDAVEAAEDAEEAKEAIEDMSATASVDSSVGTPSVTVTKTTISGHENLDFAFHNLKGDVGTLPIASSTGVDSAKINDKTNNVASGDGALAVNGETKATGDAATAIGWQSEAHGDASNARGYKTKATGVGAESSGISSVATGNYSEAHGRATVASGEASASFGFGTKASQPNQFVVGKYNAENSDDVVIVGGGTANNARKNIVSVETDGDVRVKGKMYFDANDDGTGGTEVKAYASGKGIKIDNNAIKARIGNGLRFMPNLEQGNEGYDIAADYTKVQSAITNDNKLDYSLIANTPTIPTKTSDLDNDSGFITSAYHDASKQNVLTAGAGLGINSDVISVNCGDGLMSANHILKVKAGEGIGFAQNGSLKVALGDNTIINTVDGLKVDKTVIQAKSDNSLTTTDKTVVGAINEVNAGKSSVSVSASGTSTDEVSYITINGVEKKLAGGETYTEGAGIEIYNNCIAVDAGRGLKFSSGGSLEIKGSESIGTSSGGKIGVIKADDSLMIVNTEEESGLKVNTDVIQPKITSDNKLDYSLLANTPSIPSVSVSASGTSTDEVKYITIDGVEKKLAGGDVPTITITLAQVISQSPLTIQLTEAQQDIVEAEANAVIIADLTALGMAKSYFKKVSVTSSIILLTDEYFNSLQGKGGAWKFSYDVDNGQIVATQFIFANDSDLTSLSNTVSSHSTEIANKVDKVTGKGLSTNDFDNAEKAKADGAVRFDTAMALTDAQKLQARANIGILTTLTVSCKPSEVGDTTVLSGISVTIKDGNDNTIAAGTFYGVAISFSLPINQVYKVITSATATIGGVVYFNPVGSGSEGVMTSDITVVMEYASTRNIQTMSNVKTFLALDLPIETKRNALVSSETNSFTFNIDLYGNGTESAKTATMPIRVLEVDTYEQLVNDEVVTFLGAKCQPAYIVTSKIFDQREQVESSAGETFSADLRYFAATTGGVGDKEFTLLVEGTDYQVGDDIDTYKSTHSVFVFKNGLRNNSNQLAADKNMIRYGSNITHLSNVHKWLNGSGFDWFESSYVGDICSYSGTLGYKSWFRNEDLSLIRDNVAWGVYERSGFELANNKMWCMFALPSVTEFAGSANAYEGTVTEYWKYLNGGAISNSANASRTIKNSGGTAQYMWFRSPYRSSSYNPWRLYPSGSCSGSYYACYSTGVAPLFVI